MTSNLDYLEQAAQLALNSDRQKHYLLGAVVKRTDGAIVKSGNSRTIEQMHKAHAEVRVLRKADFGCTLYVARVLRSGGWAMAKPCKKCQAFIRARGVKKVYYTIGQADGYSLFGVWNVVKTKEP